jgi:hydroxyacylglutathione hydrolase
MTDPVVIPIVDEGLGNSAYLVDLGDGRALAVDPSRDLRSLRAAADAHRLAVAYVAETHLHADFLSGARQLAADDGAQIVASADGGREFGHRGLADGDELDLGGLRLRAWATPGHTDEHLSYLLLDGAQPAAVFTGGSLLVGAAARTDLVDPAATERLARAQYRSLRRLTSLPDATVVYPTHGAGSFCAAPRGAERTTTVGREVASNPLLAAGGEDAFVTALLEGLGSFPGYFLRLAERNRRGPAVLDTPPGLTPLTPAQVRALQDGGGLVIDARPKDAYAAAHVPGALAIPLRPSFATWLGWLVPDPTPALVFVTGPDQDVTEAVWQALKIGYDNLAGHLHGGLAAWTAAGYPTRTTPLLTPHQADLPTVVDVRQVSEYRDQHLPSAVHIELGGLAAVARDLAGPLATMCSHGERATTAASLLERAGHTDIAILEGGPAEWAQATGRRLEET